MEEKRIPFLIFTTAFLLAATADLLGFIPGIGAIYIGFARLSFWMLGYNAEKSHAAISAITEITPVFSILPTCMLFTVLFYNSNKQLVKKQIAAEKAFSKKKAEQEPVKNYRFLA